MKPGMTQQWKAVARRLKREVRALYLAYRDPRTPWYGRAFAAIVVAYALSPIDLIPDPIPVLGYLDDLILIPLGVALALRMIPPRGDGGMPRACANGAGHRRAGELGRRCRHRASSGWRSPHC